MLEVLLHIMHAELQRRWPDLTEEQFRQAGRRVVGRLAGPAGYYDLKPLIEAELEKEKA